MGYTENMKMKPKQSSNKISVFEAPQCLTLYRNDSENTEKMDGIQLFFGLTDY